MKVFNRGLKAYWNRSSGELPDRAARRRRRPLAKAELGGGRRMRSRIRIRIRIAQRLRALRNASPRRLLVWIRDAYETAMVAFARSVSIGGGAEVFGMLALPVKEHDERLMAEIYKSIMERRGNAAVEYGGEIGGRR